MRQFPRPGRVIERLGNHLPDVSGEINVLRYVRATTDPGMGVVRLGLTTFVTEPRPRVLVTDSDTWSS